MSPPTPSDTAVSRARPAIKWTTEGLDPARVRLLVNAGETVCAGSGVPMRRRRIRELVISFMRDGRIDGDFSTWFISYVDPTGERAVRNVMRR